MEHNGKPLHPHRAERPSSCLGKALPCLLIGLILLACAPPLHAVEHLILYREGTRDEATWNAFRKYLSGKGLTMTLYDAPQSVEKQVENANRINREKALFMLAVELVPSDRTDAFVAVSNAKKGKGLILNADEVPGSHADRSGDLASSIAAVFRKKVKPIPLFMFYGIDMPGVFVRLEVPKSKPADAFDKLHEGMLNYMKRGKDERELKGERRNTSP